MIIVPKTRLQRNNLKWLTTIIAWNDIQAIYRCIELHYYIIMIDVHHTVRDERLRYVKDINNICGSSNCCASYGTSFWKHFLWLEGVREDVNFSRKSIICSASLLLSSSCVSVHKHSREIKKSGSICYWYMLIYCHNIHKVDAIALKKTRT